MTSREKQEQECHSPQHFNDSKLRQFLSCRQFLWSNNPQLIPFSQTHAVSSLRRGDVSFAHSRVVPTTPTGKELPRLLFVAQKPPPFFCSKPGLFSFHLLLLCSCSWGNQQVYSYPPCPCWSLSYRFFPFSFSCPFSRLSSNYSPAPRAAAIPHLWLFSLPQFEAFPSLLCLLGWMTRKNHRELKVWD